MHAGWWRIYAIQTSFIQSSYNTPGFSQVSKILLLLQEVLVRYRLSQCCGSGSGWSVISWSPGSGSVILYNGSGFLSFIRFQSLQSEWVLAELWMSFSPVWMSFSRVVRASDLSMPMSEQCCVQSYHLPTQWNLRGGRWSSVRVQKKTPFFDIEGFTRYRYLLSQNGDIFSCTVDTKIPSRIQIPDL